MVYDLKSIYKASLLSVLLAFVFLSAQAQDIEKKAFEQTGTASFYNKKFNGRHTSSGERLDNSRYTAAHCSIPFGTLVRVTNLSNGKSVIVKVNDRFYPRKGHILDITYSAAQEIDMVRQGVARIKLEVLDLTESEAEAKAIIPADTVTFKLPESRMKMLVSKLEIQRTVKLP